MSWVAPSWPVFHINKHKKGSMKVVKAKRGRQCSSVVVLPEGILQQHEKVEAYVIILAVFWLRNTEGGL